MTDGFRTLGQPAAVEAVRALVRHGPPHALLLAGPGGVGKSTLALDLAAALLCQAPDPAARPCRACRGCRMVEHGNHPDLHRLAPSGAGGGIGMGGRGERGVRDLVADLALLPVEGGARVAIVEAAHRMSEDAQSAFLKTLEEPPAGTTIVLCADDEERLLPTIRSRTIRVRLGAMGPRGVEAVLGALGVADAPTAARLARLTDGRPGRAIAYALAPDAVAIRNEIARTLLDLTASGLTARLAGIRDLAGRAAELGRALEVGSARAAQASSGSGSGDGATPPGASGRAGARGRESGKRRNASPVAPDGAVDGAAEDAEVEGSVTRIPAAERRRAALTLVDVWRAVLRDLVLVGHEATPSVRDLDLVDDLRAATARLGPTAAGRFLRELDLAGEQLEGNVSPELVLDVLAYRWGGRLAA